MNSEKVARADTGELVRVYRAAAKEHCDAIERADVQAANKAANLVATTYSELRRRGIEHQLKLLPLLSDINASVRAWAASHALEFAPVEGEAVLERLRTAKSLIGHDAEMTLKEWRAGRLRFP